MSRAISSQVPGAHVDRRAAAATVPPTGASVFGDRCDRRPTKSERIEMVAAASAALDAAKQSLDETVRQARRDGASWGEIGAALGITRQAAFQRFSD